MNGGLAALRERSRRLRHPGDLRRPGGDRARSSAEAARACCADGHEIAAHGFKHEDVSTLDREEEKARLDRTTEILADVTGRRPAGWFSLPRQGDKYAAAPSAPTRWIC